MDPRQVVLEPLAYPFMVNGLAEVALLAVAAGLVGPFVVHRNLTFLAHALSHTILPALIVAAAMRLAPALGAAAGAVVTVGLVFGLRRSSPDVRDDSSVGITFIGLFALGVVLVGLLHVRSRDLGAAVTGNLLGVGPAELLASAVLVVIVVGVVVGLYGPLVMTTFDPVMAQAIGLPVALLELLVLGMVAGTTIVAASVVGVILAVAVLVTPAATAHLWGGSLGRTMLIGGGVAAGGGALGLYMAYYTPLPPAAVIVLAFGASFVLSVLRGWRGWLAERHPEGR